MAAYGYTNQGLCDSEKPTSRVIRPPGGGGSLNIFGGGDPAPPKPTSQPAKPAPQPVKQSPQPVKQAPQEPVTKPSSEPKITPTAPASGPKRSSTKVHAPPGGKSSISFY